MRRIVREFTVRPSRAEIDRTVQCDGKFQHVSQHDAQRAIRRDKNARLNSYRCPHCRFWHVGSSIIRRRERW